jgi:hypothetical protein
MELRGEEVEARWLNAKAGDLRWTVLSALALLTRPLKLNSVQL